MIDILPPKAKPRKRPDIKLIDRKLRCEKYPEITSFEQLKRRKVMIDIKDVIKDYKTGPMITHVLKGINFRVYEGEFLGIMGPSGSGKSTTLQQLALLDHPTDGRIVINDVTVTELSEFERSSFRLHHLGYVFQQYKNIPELTALENVYLPAKMAGRDPKEYTAAAKKLLDAVGLSHRYHHRPYELSGGEQQRVAIARALINQPAILFADEPTASLDTASSDVILELLTEFNKKYGQTIVMVTHEPDQARYFDRVVRIKDGLVESDTINQERRTKTRAITTHKVIFS